MRTGATGGDLLYAEGYSQSAGSGVTFILSYPQGQLVGSIDAVASGLCSDAQGNVFFLYRNAAIEYAHGGTQPIRTARIPGAATQACAVDPLSGNLAVTFYCPPCGYQNLAIFSSGSGQPVRYQAPQDTSVTYDNEGNLFLAGYDAGGEIAELPNGSSQFLQIASIRTSANPDRFNGTVRT